MVNLLKNLMAKIKKSLPVKLKIRLKNLLRNFRAYLGIKNESKNAEEWIYPPQGSGDVLYLMLCLSEIYKNKKFNFVLERENLRQIAMLFPENIGKIEKRCPSKGTLLYTWDCIYRHTDKTSSFTELFRLATGATLDLKKTTILDSGLNTGIFKQLQIEESDLARVVLICPEALSCPGQPSPEYWVKYANNLKEKGFIPVFNSLSKFGKFRNIFLSIRDTIALFDYVDYLIGFRSGLMDVLMYFKSPKTIILYPRTPHDCSLFIQNFNDKPEIKYKEFTSLSLMYPNKSIREYIFDNKKYFYF